MRMRHTWIGLVLVAVVAGMGVTAEAQRAAPGPGWVQMPDGGWLPPGHPATQGMASTTITVIPVPTVTPVEVLTGCDHLDTATGRKATDCVIGTYRVGKVYAFGTVERAIVLGVAASPSGVEVVTVQFLDVFGTHRGGPDHVLAFRNDGAYRPWTYTSENGY